MTSRWRKRLKTITPARTALAAAALLFAVAAGHAQMSLPPKLRGPEPRGPDAAQLRRGQTAYVMANCHLCHGPTLAEARGGGADLYNSTLVLDDDHGDMIGPVVRAGIPFTQTAMPRYPDLPQADLVDMVAYIHFMRQVLREQRALAAGIDGASGSVGAGRSYFFEKCASCHADDKDLSRVVAGNSGAALLRAILRPAPASDQARADATGREAHLRLLEGYTPADLANLIAYLQSTEGKLTGAHARAMIAPPREIQTRFERKCSNCHGPGGSGGDRGPPLVNSASVAARGDDGLRAAIREGLPGGMPAFRMSDRELNEYVALLKKRNPAP